MNGAATTEANRKGNIRNPMEGVEVEVVEVEDDEGEDEGKKTKDKKRVWKE